ncbi:MAG: FHA domain-containing serine/threonine-protein kinase [Myxococcales bacterium]|nr:FHA domain-containing serine/threonine-protein kinase [Myxococcales bacterium]
MSPFEFALPGAPESPGFAFPAPRFTVGSAPEVGLRFDARLVQPQHAEVALDAKGVPWIRDLTNQGLLWVNGAQTSRAALTPGSMVRLGRLDLEVRQTGLQEVGLDSTAKRPTPFATPPLDSTAKRPTPFQAPPSVRPSQGRLPALTREASSGHDATKLSGAFVPAAVDPAPVGDSTFRRTVLPEGSTVGGRYRIIKKLAAGGMGEVYQAEHIELHKQFAVKVMLPALSSDQEFVARFKREAISASRIGQQNIIDISDFGQTDDGRFYFVMEFLDGVTIASLLHRQGPLPVPRMVNIALQTSRALAAAHAQGIVHRDMKPENVMVLQRRGQPDFVKVLDFGVAKVSTGPALGGQTQLGMVVGTPQYMSPEQAMGVAVDSRTDTYALGLILYEMLSGKPTFHGDTASILMVKQVTEPAPPFSAELSETMPAALHDLIFQMLEKDPNKRPESLDKVVEALETLLAHLRVGAKLPTATVSGRFPSTATPHTVSPVRVTSSGLPIAPPQTRHERVPISEPEDTLPPPPAKSKAPFIIAGVLLLVIIGAGAVAAFKPAPTPEVPVVIEPVALDEPKKVEPPPPPPPSAPKLVKLTLETKPEGAEVFEKDVSLGVTPMVLSREAQVIVDLRFVLKGHVDLVKKLAMPLADESRSFELEKKRTKAKSGGSGLKDLDFEQANDLKDLE